MCCTGYGVVDMRLDDRWETVKVPTLSETHIIVCVSRNIHTMYKKHSRMYEQSMALICAVKCCCALGRLRLHDRIRRMIAVLACGGVVLCCFHDAMLGKSIGLVCCCTGTKVEGFRALRLMTGTLENRQCSHMCQQLTALICVIKSCRPKGSGEGKDWRMLSPEERVMLGARLL